MTHSILLIPEDDLAVLSAKVSHGQTDVNGGKTKSKARVYSDHERLKVALMIMISRFISANPKSNSLQINYMTFMHRKQSPMLFKSTYDCSPMSIQMHLISYNPA